MTTPHTHRQLCILPLASACLLVLLTGCGGGPPLAEYEQPAGTRNAQAAAAITPQAYGGSANRIAVPAAAPARMDTSSFTVNSAAQFKGFNHKVWNDKRSWYECDCGNTPQSQPASMPWNTAG